MDGYELASFSVIFTLELEKCARKLNLTEEQIITLVRTTVLGSLALLKDESLKCQKPTL